MSSLGLTGLGTSNDVQERLAEVEKHLEFCKQGLEKEAPLSGVRKETAFCKKALDDIRETIAQGAQDNDISEKFKRLQTRYDDLSKAVSLKGHAIFDDMDLAANIGSFLEQRDLAAFACARTTARDAKKIVIQEKREKLFQVKRLSLEEIRYYQKELELGKDDWEAFFQLCPNLEVLTDLNLQGESSRAVEAMIAAMIPHLPPSLKVLPRAISQALSNEDLIQFIEKHPHLEAIEIWNNPANLRDQTNERFSIYASVPNLRHIDLNFLPVPNEELHAFLIQCPQATSIALRVDGLQSNETLSILSNHPRLTHVLLSGCPYVTPENVQEAFESGFEQLQHLSLQGHWVSNSILGALGANAKITSLTLENGSLYQEGVQALSQLPLTHLQMVGDLHPGLLGLAGHPTLKTLDLSGNSDWRLSPGEANEILRRLLETCPCLERLNLEGCDWVSDETLAIIAGFQNINRVDLRPPANSPFLTLDGLRAFHNTRPHVTNYMSQLRGTTSHPNTSSHTLFSNSNATSSALSILSAKDIAKFARVNHRARAAKDKAIVRLLSERRSMTYDELCDCQKALRLHQNDWSLLKHCKNLERIEGVLVGAASAMAPFLPASLRELPGAFSTLEPNQLKEIFKRCPAIRHIDCCHALADEQLQACADAQQLTSISLRGNQWFKNAGLQRFLKACPQLEDIDLSKCRWVNGETLQILAAHPKLRSCGLGAGWQNLATAEQLQQALTNGFPCLQRLDLSDRWVRDEHLKVIAETPRITHLNLDNCDWISSSSLKVFAEGKNLQHLGLRDGTLAEASFTWVLADITSLRNVDLRKSQGRSILPMGGEGWKEMAKKCPDLSHLDLRECFWLTPEVLLALLEFPKLKRVDLDRAILMDSSLKNAVQELMQKRPDLIQLH